MSLQICYLTTVLSVSLLSELDSALNESIHSYFYILPFYIPRLVNLCSQEGT